MLIERSAALATQRDRNIVYTGIYPFAGSDVGSGGHRSNLSFVKGMAGQNKAVQEQVVLDSYIDYLHT